MGGGGARASCGHMDAVTRQICEKQWLIHRVLVEAVIFGVERICSVANSTSSLNGLQARVQRDTVETLATEYALLLCMDLTYTSHIVKIQTLKITRLDYFNV